MLIIGARGFAKQVFEDVPAADYPALSFFDEVNMDTDMLWNEYPILHTLAGARNYFEHTDNRFVLGIGSPGLRYQFSERFSQLNGKLINLISTGSTISKRAQLGTEGINILRGVIIEGDAVIGNGCLINLNATITHDSAIGEYSCIFPGVHISGGCTIGRFCQIGAGAVVLPHVKIGDAVIVGAGAVVTKDISDNSKVVGIPARKKK